MVAAFYTLMIAALMAIVIRAGRHEPAA